MYFCVKNKKLKSKNLPIKPAKGGIPDIDKNISTIVIETKLYLLKIFKFDKVFIFLMSYKNNKLKNRYSINIYIYMFKYIIAIP